MWLVLLSFFVFLAKGWPNLDVFEPETIWPQGKFQLIRVSCFNGDSEQTNKKTNCIKINNSKLFFLVFWRMVSRICYFLAQNTKKNLSIKVLAQYVYTYGKGYKQVKRDKLRTTLKGPCTRFEMEHMSYN